MASIVLGVVGTLVGGPLGGVVGSMVGGYVDQNFLFPALFPPETIEGPRLDEMKIQSSDEGAPGNYIVGGVQRVAGAVIWVSDMVETRTEVEQGGGKGGTPAGPPVATYNYYVDLALGIAMQSGVGIVKIFAEGKLLYNRSPNVSITSTLVSVTKLGSGSKSRMKISSPAIGPDLSTLAIGYDVVITGFSNGANNGTFKVLSNSRDRAAGTSYVVVKNTACVVEGSGSLAAMSQTVPTYDPTKVQELTFYTGSSPQTPNSLIQAYEGAANTPGYAGTAYIVMKQLALADYGNRIPHFAVIAEAGTATVPATVSAIWTRSGRSSGEIDVTGLSGTMSGFSVTGPFSPSSALQPIMLAYDVLAQESSGTMRFFHRVNATIVEVDERHLAAHEFGSDAVRPLEIEEDPSSEGPSEVNVKYVDLEADNQSGSQRERRRDYTTDSVINIDLQIVMTGAKARGIARRLLWTAWANKKKFKLKLPPRYMHIQENDCIRLKSLGESWLLLVQKVDFGKNDVIEVEATLENRDVLNQVEEADLPYTGSTSLASQSDDSEVVNFEPPPFSPALAIGGPSEAVIIHSVAMEDPGMTFPGCKVYASADGSNFQPWLTLTGEGVLGYATTVLNGTGISYAYWDRVSTVDVYLFSGTLASITDEQTLDGMNRALIGSEIIGFATATLVSTNTYRLSNLLRGLRNTEDAMTTHAIGDTFGFLDAGVFGKNIPASWIGSTRYFRYVFAAQSLADAESYSLAITGKTLKPFSPAALDVSKDVVGVVTGTITRRTRMLMRLFAPALTPLWEESEKYEVDIVYPAGGGTVVRTVTLTGTNSFTYSEAQQIADSVVAFDPIEYRIFQISAIVGRGKSLVYTG